MSLLLLVTGGTLDKDYLATSGELSFSDTHLPQMLAQAQVTLDIEIETLMLKDSLEMTEQDRQQILQACQNSSANQVVITHGTDTMTDTADYLNDHFQSLEKTIVLTGAMRPHKLVNSDALFNLGTAIMAAQTSKPGIFIAMNGQLFDAGNVRKNRTKGLFEALGS